MPVSNPAGHPAYRAGWMDGGGAESSAMGSMLAMASPYLLVLRSEHKSRGRSGSVGCRSAGKQRDKFLFSGAERKLQLPCCLLA